MPRTFASGPTLNQSCDNSAGPVLTVGCQLTSGIAANDWIIVLTGYNNNPDTFVKVADNQGNTFNDLINFGGTHGNLAVSGVAQFIYSSSPSLPLKVNLTLSGTATSMGIVVLDFTNNPSQIGTDYATATFDTNAGGSCASTSNFTAPVSLLTNPQLTVGAFWNYGGYQQIAGHATGYTPFSNFGSALSGLYGLNVAGGGYEPSIIVSNGGGAINTCGTAVGVSFGTVYLTITTTITAVNAPNPDQSNFWLMPMMFLFIPAFVFIIPAMMIKVAHPKVYMLLFSGGLVVGTIWGILAQITPSWVLIITGLLFVGAFIF